MPNRTTRLKDEARAAAILRGHRLTTFVTQQKSTQTAGGIYTAGCMRCGRAVTVMPDPPPNGVAIGGDAAALDCPGKAVSASIRLMSSGGRFGTGVIEFTMLKHEGDLDLTALMFEVEQRVNRRMDMRCHTVLQGVTHGKEINE